MDLIILIYRAFLSTSKQNFFHLIGIQSQVFRELTYGQILVFLLSDFFLYFLDEVTGVSFTFSGNDHYIFCMDDKAFHFLVGFILYVCFICTSSMVVAYCFAFTKLRALTACFSCKNTLKQHKVYCSEVLTLNAFGFI